MCLTFLGGVLRIFHITVVKLIEIDTHKKMVLDMFKCYQALLAALVTPWTLICKIINKT